MSRFLALSLAAGAVAQTTHLVGPGAHPTINAALAVSSSGDVVIVMPGSYPGFTASIGITVRAAVNGTVAVGPSSMVQSSQPVHLVDLDLTGLSVQGGICSLHHCRVPTAPGGWNTCVAVANSRVHLIGCTIGQPGNSASGGFFAPAGLQAFGSTISAVDTTILGFDFGFAAPAGAGVHLVSSRFHGSGLTVHGGTGVSMTSLMPGPAVQADALSPVWIADSTLAGGAATTIPGGAPVQCPVVASAGRLARCTLLPASCAPPAIAVNGPLVGARQFAPPLAGAPFLMSFTTAPNGLVGVFASLAVSGSTLAGLEQPLLLDLGSLVPLVVLVADGAGAASSTCTLPAGISNVEFWLQGVTPGPLPMQLSPAIGGVAR